MGLGLLVVCGLIVGEVVLLAKVSRQHKRIAELEEKISKTQEK